MADNVLAQLLSPTLARQAEQQRLQGQVLGTATASNPLLAEAGRTANLMRGSAGRLFGTDLRSPQEVMAEKVKQIHTSNMKPEEKIAAMKQLDLGLGTAYEANVLATQKAQKELEPTFSIEKLPFGAPNPFTGKRAERAAVVKDGQFVRWLNADEVGPDAEVSVAPEEKPEGELTDREKLQKNLRDFLATPEAIEAAKSGKPIRLPTGTIVRFDRETQRWVPYTPESVDIQGELGVNP